MGWNVLDREKHSKKDGWLAELVSMDYDDEPFEDVHSYVVSFNPGTTRAMHYHKTKKEWLALGTGRIKVVLEDIESEKKETIILSDNDEKEKIIFFPPKVAHAIKNVGNTKGCVVVFSKTPEIPGDTVEYEMDV